MFCGGNNVAQAGEMAAKCHPPNGANGKKMDGRWREFEDFEGERDREEFTLFVEGGRPGQGRS